MPKTKKEKLPDAFGALLSTLDAEVREQIQKSISAESAEIKELIKSNAKLEVKIGDKIKIVKGRRHIQFENLVTVCSLRLNALMVGMAGTGKTHAAEQAAEALGLPFYTMSVGAQTSKTDIIGYMNASGEYVRTHFREAYEHGGVFLMDEIDAGNANVLIQVNAALSNNACAFPDQMVSRHKDFIFIASANTYGNGANRQYVGRNQLDAATLDRFIVIDWLIDAELEKSLAGGNEKWYEAVLAGRKYVTDRGVRALITPRCTQKGAQLLNSGIAVESVIDAVALQSVPDDQKADVKKVMVDAYVN